MHSCFNRWRLIVVGCTLVLLEVHSECVRDLLQDHFKFDVFARREQHRIALQVLNSAACCCLPEVFIFNLCGVLRVL